MRSSPSGEERVFGRPSGEGWNSPIHPDNYNDLLQRLGPTFIKIGQFLALRPDLVPQSYCDELMKLLDLVQPFAWTEAKAILARELGADPDALFAYINQRPLAAGSLAQVHLARLEDGRAVAVKILRPNIEHIVQRDLKRVRRIARFLGKTGLTFIVSPMEAVDELAEWLMQEIDLSRELANMSRLYRLAALSPNQRIPRPYPDLCSAQVLTAEYLRGIPVSEVLRALRSSRSDGILNLVDCSLFAERLVLASLHQIFRYQFFHADLHPGNLMILPGNVVGFVDFGLCDELDDRIRERQLRYLAAIYSGETERIFRALTEILIPSEETDMEAFRRDFLDESRRLESNGRTRTAENDATDVERSTIAAYLVGVMRAARRNKLQVPTRILSMYRALLTVETVANQLGTRDGLRLVGREFFGNLVRDEFVTQLSDPSNLEGMFFRLVSLKRESPGQLSQILTDLAAGSLTIRMETSEAGNTTRTRNRRARLITSAILTVSLSLLLTISHLPVFFGISLRWPSAIALLCLYVWIFWQWRHL